MRKKILITGAGGFIGSFIVEEALARNYDTWAGIRNSTNREYLQNNRIHFIDLQYSNKSNLKKQFSVFLLCKLDYRCLRVWDMGFLLLLKKTL